MTYLFSFLFTLSLSLRSPLLFCERQGIDADEGACGGDRWWMAVTAVGRSTGTQLDKNMECSNVQTFNESKPLLHNNQIYNYLPQDYDMTDDDICAQITIETSSSTDVLVKINDIAPKQDQLLPILDENEYLDDNVSTPSYLYGFLF
uniref:Neprosin activation peptide domain-containing protein n=1 Tax=Oryza barthii TaxID=65489 RepID=A0A0D3G4R5_9ORYZ